MRGHYEHCKESVCAPTRRWKEEGFHACSGLTEAQWHTYHHSVGLHASHQPRDSCIQHRENALHTVVAQPIKNKPKMHALNWPADGKGDIFMNRTTAHTCSTYSFRKATSYACRFFLTESNLCLPTCQNRKRKKKKKKLLITAATVESIDIHSGKRQSNSPPLPHTHTHTKKHMSRLYTHKAE